MHLSTWKDKGGVRINALLEGGVRIKVVEQVQPLRTSKTE
jgi:hypothetical protein